MAEPPPVPKPPVVDWFRAYCAAMALLYLAVFVAGIVVVFLRDRLGQQDDTPPVLMAVWGAFLTLLGLAFAAAFAAGLFLPPRPWVWIYDIVLICVGLSSPCCMLASIPLLIFWIKPEARVYFGRAA